MTSIPDHEVTLNFTWPTMKRAVGSALRNGYAEYETALRDELIREVIDWCGDHTPSYRYNTFDLETFTNTMFRDDFDFSNPKVPYYPISFHFRNAVDAIYFKMRWV